MEATREETVGAKKVWTRTWQGIFRGRFPLTRVAPRMPRRSLPARRVRARRWRISDAQVSGLHVVVVKQLVRRGVVDHLSLAHHIDAIGEGEREGEVLLD